MQTKVNNTNFVREEVLKTKNKVVKVFNLNQEVLEKISMASLANGSFEEHILVSDGIVLYKGELLGYYIPPKRSFYEKFFDSLQEPRIIAILPSKEEIHLEEDKYGNWHLRSVECEGCDVITLDKPNIGFRLLM